MASVFPIQMQHFKTANSTPKIIKKLQYFLQNTTKHSPGRNRENYDNHDDVTTQLYSGSFVVVVYVNIVVDFLLGIFISAHL